MKSFKRDLKLIIILIAVILFIRIFLIQSYLIPTGSMENTLLPGDFVVAQKFSYLFTHHTPNRGEVVVFKYPLSRYRIFIKRCIGLPGDTIKIVNKKLYINGILQTEPYVVHLDPKIIPGLQADIEFQKMWEKRLFTDEERVRDNFGPVVVPPGNVFVMGDNRDYSYDSRFWGPLPVENIIGKPLMVFLSINTRGKLWEKVRWNRLFKVIR